LLPLGASFTSKRRAGVGVARRRLRVGVLAVATAERGARVTAAAELLAKASRARAAARSPARFASSCDCDGARGSRGSFLRREKGAPAVAFA